MKQIIEPVHSKLPTKILVKKKEMIEFGERYGLTDERTIKSSQQLDHLLNNYQMHFVLSDDAAVSPPILYFKIGFRVATHMYYGVHFVQYNNVAILIETPTMRTLKPIEVI